VTGRREHEVAVGVRRLEAPLDPEACPLVWLVRPEAPVDAVRLRRDLAREATAAAGDAGKRPVGAAAADGRPRNLAEQLEALGADGSRGQRTGQRVVDAGAVVAALAHGIRIARTGEVDGIQRRAERVP